MCLHYRGRHPVVHAASTAYLPISWLLLAIWELLVLSWGLVVVLCSFCCHPGLTNMGMAQPYNEHDGGGGLASILLWLQTWVGEHDGGAGLDSILLWLLTVVGEHDGGAGLVSILLWL